MESMQTEKSDAEIIYVGDPMCSWCWGFAPVLDAMVEDFASVAGLRVVVGGLRPGPNAQQMDASSKQMIRSHWKHVEDATGQPFDYTFFDREDFLYDTEPAARAVVTVRALVPSKTFAFFKALQSAFYANNVDITEAEMYRPYLESEGIDFQSFLDAFNSETMHEATSLDFSTAQQWGIRGFPSVVLRKDEHLALLTAGYQPYKHLKPLVTQFFNSDPTV